MIVVISSSLFVFVDTAGDPDINDGFADGCQRVAEDVPNAKRQKKAASAAAKAPAASAIGSGTQGSSETEPQEEYQEQPEEEGSINESSPSLDCREAQQEPLQKKRKLRRRTTFCTICHTTTCEGADICEEKERQECLKELVRKQQETKQEEERERVTIEQPTPQLNGEPMHTEAPTKEPPQQPENPFSCQLTHPVFG